MLSSHMALHKPVEDRRHDLLRGVFLEKMLGGQPASVP